MSNKAKPALAFMTWSQKTQSAMSAIFITNITRYKGIDVGGRTGGQGHSAEGSVERKMAGSHLGEVQSATSPHLKGNCSSV